MNYTLPNVPKRQMYIEIEIKVYASREIYIYYKAK